MLEKKNFIKTDFAGNGNGTQAVPTAPPPPKSDGTIIKLPFYFSFGSLLVALNMYV